MPLAALTIDGTRREAVLMLSSKANGKELLLLEGPGDPDLVSCRFGIERLDVEFEEKADCVPDHDLWRSAVFAECCGESTQDDSSFDGVL